MRPTVVWVAVCLAAVAVSSSTLEGQRQNRILTTAAATGPYGGTTTLSATLTNAGSPVTGRSVDFSLNGTPVGSATTNANGVATLAGVSLAGLVVGSYPSAVQASFAGDSSYDTSAGTASLTVSPKQVAPVVTAANKTYDRSTTATVTSCTVTGAVGGDVVACTGTAAFDTALVGTGKTVTAIGLTLTGAAAGNYALATTTATTTAAITARTVTPVATAANKIYDGTTAATLTSCTLTGALGGDVVACTGTATFAQRCCRERQDRHGHRLDADGGGGGQLRPVVHDRDYDRLDYGADGDAIRDGGEQAL